MGWLDKLKPRKYAVIDGRSVTEPIYQKGDTAFTVTGASDWGSTSKYNVHLNGPESYYEYKTLTAPKDDASSGGNIQETIIIKGNDPERLNRYRMYERMLTPEDYKSWWQHMFSKTPEKACGGKVQKGKDGMITGEFAPNWNQGEIRQGFQPARSNWLQKFDTWADKVSEDLNNPKKSGPLSLIVAPTFDYLTQRPGNIGYAAILPGTGATNSAGKAAVKKTAEAIKKSAQLDKEIEMAFQERGLREAMAKWDKEAVASNSKQNWLDKALYNLTEKDSRVRDFIVGVTGLSTPGMAYFSWRKNKKNSKSNQEEKSEPKEKSENKACGGKMKKKK